MAQVRLARKAEVQAQRRAEKAAKEAAAREADMRSYKHIMQACAHPSPLGIHCRMFCRRSMPACSSEVSLAGCQGTMQAPSLGGCYVQDENMVSSKEVAQKYQSFADYEEDFM